MAFQMFWGAMAPLREAGKLGMLAFQFPPYFIAKPANFEYLARLPERLPEASIAIEFRHPSGVRDETTILTGDQRKKAAYRAAIECARSQGARHYKLQSNDALRGMYLALDAAEDGLLCARDFPTKSIKLTRLLALRAGEVHRSSAERWLSRRMGRILSIAPGGGGLRRYLSGGERKKEEIGRFLARQAELGVRIRSVLPTSRSSPEILCSAGRNSAR
jgi:uncharacterized protein DUF72